MTDQQPIGNSCDPIFTLTDLLDVEREFPGQDVYFGNPNHTVICVNAVGDAKIQWCASKEESWSYQGWSGTIVPHDPTITTPEPTYALMLFVMFVLMLFVLIRKGLKL